MIVTKNLQKSFHGNKVLCGIDEHIEKGEKVDRPVCSGNLHFCDASTFWKNRQAEKCGLRGITSQAKIVISTN